MSKYIPRTKKQMMEAMPNQISVYFHLNNILGIKEALGKECTAVYHQSNPKYTLQEVLDEEGNPKKGMFKRVLTSTNHFVVAKFKGTTKPIKAALNGTPDDIKAEYYAQLKNDMTNAARKRGVL